MSQIRHNRNFLLEFVHRHAKVGRFFHAFGSDELYGHLNVIPNSDVNSSKGTFPDFLFQRNFTLSNQRRI